MRNLLMLFLIGFCFNASAQQLQFRTGDKAPTFSAVTHSGNNYSLPSKGTTILLFYRGYWCPFCNRQLSALSDSLSLLEGKGANVVAVTPEKYESAEKTIAKTKASFTIISDTTNSILKLYGVNFTVDSNTVSKYKGYEIDFTAVNGNTENTLPVPAVFIIKDGIISYTWFDKDYRKRPTVKELLEHL